MKRTISHYQLPQKFAQTTSVLTGLVVLTLALVPGCKKDEPPAPKIAEAPKTEAPKAPAVDPSEPPRLVSTSPAAGSVDVDPALTEITVTFDQDMGEGCSWTGGGPEYPAIPEGAKVQWRKQRTCVLPVKLESGRYYRVGINSPSYQNFRSVSGVPAPWSAIYFTTRGASLALKRKVLTPQIVAINPRNNASDVDPALKELRVTFNVEMAGGFSWTGGGPEFPPIPDGKKPFWTEDHKTCILPVQLQPGSGYRLGLNSPSFHGFQSAGGIALEPVTYTFRTR